MAGFRAYAKGNTINLNLDGLDPAWPGVRIDETASAITGTLRARASTVGAALVDDGAGDSVTVTLF